MSNEYKIQKYLSKIKSSNSSSKKIIYEAKLYKYQHNQHGGIGSTNTLIVFDSSKIVGSNLESTMNESNGQNIKIPMMTISDLEKILSQNAYVIEEKKKIAKLFGTSIISKTLDKAKQKISSIDINVLKSDDIKKANSELKNIENIFNTTEKLLSNASSLLVKKMDETKTLNENYSSLLSERQSQNYTVMAECTNNILLLSQGLLSNIEERNTKITDLNELLKIEKNDYLQKINSINEKMNELIQLNQKTLELEKSYNDSIKTYNSCTISETELKLSNEFTIVNAEEIAREIVNITKDKLKLDSYIICVINTFGKNELLKIAKLQ